MTVLTKTESLDKVLAEMNMRSKKKRARKKFIKQAMQQLATENQTVAADTPAETKAAYAYDKLPVGFMIKTGKQHFPEEAVFRFYYNQNHPQEYKNKELLTERFQTLVEAATGPTKTSLTEAINQQTSK
ncbi:hypothetical protein SAMN05421663_104238 [Terribacillus halophilus]|uniref:Uncharacterized protein n=1 Tax=Terribacillus halophilus TaxID=361279 RepID=A0A1G6PRR7_9BACI|nr:hypothetical protein [Terribacillus halophilus]SDC82779.1 hypothetical protein SAMN05421663_104238 [Terribacillus halophilus]